MMPVPIPLAIYAPVSPDQLRGRHDEYSETAQAYEVLMSREAAKIVNGEPESRLTREDLGLILHYTVGVTETTPTKLTQILKHKGITLKATHIKNEFVKVFKVDWQVSDEFKVDLQNYLAGRNNVIRMKLKE